MQINIIRLNPLIVIVVAIFSTIGFWGGVYHIDYSLIAYTPLQNIIDIFATDFPKTANVLGVILTLICSFHIMKLSLINTLYNAIKTSYIIIWFFIIISVCYFSNNYFIRPLISTIAIIYALKQIEHILNRVRISSSYWLVIGFWLSISTMFYTPSSILLLLVAAVIVIFKIWNIREWLSLIIGGLIPVVIELLIYNIIGFESYFLTDDIVHVIFGNYSLANVNELLSRNLIFVVFPILNLMLLILSVIYLLLNRRKMELYRFNSSNIVYIIGSFILVLHILFSSEGSIYMLPLLAVMLSLIINNYFIISKSISLNNIIILLYFLVSLISFWLV